ncbi:hypothetical protein D3C87_1935820 [compost metagenome]
MQYVLTGKVFIIMYIRVDDKSVDPLSLHIMRIAYYCAFYHTCMHVYGIFHFCSSNSMARYVDHIIYPSGNPVITVLIS